MSENRILCVYRTVRDLLIFKRYDLYIKFVPLHKINVNSVVKSPRDMLRRLL